MINLPLEMSLHVRPDVLCSYMVLASTIFFKTFVYINASGWEL